MSWRDKRDPSKPFPCWMCQETGKQPAGTDDPARTDPGKFTWPDGTSGLYITCRACGGDGMRREGDPADFTGPGTEPRGEFRDDCGSLVPEVWAQAAAHVALALDRAIFGESDPSARCQNSACPFDHLASERCPPIVFVPGEPIVISTDAIEGFSWHLEDVPQDNSRWYGAESSDQSNPPFQNLSAPLTVTFPMGRIEFPDEIIELLGAYGPEFERFSLSGEAIEHLGDTPSGGAPEEPETPTPPPVRP